MLQLTTNLVCTIIVCPPILFRQGVVLCFCLHKRGALVRIETFYGDKNGVGLQLQRWPDTIR